jgi:hypothetical protein
MINFVENYATDEPYIKRKRSKKQDETQAGRSTTASFLFGRPFTVEQKRNSRDKGCD